MFLKVSLIMPFLQLMRALATAKKGIIEWQGPE